MKEGFTRFQAFVLTLLAAAAIVIAACEPVQPQKNGTGNKTTAAAECISASNCGVGGCSGQVCAPAAKAQGLITTCEYREEYGCVKLTSCGCVNGKCMWQQNTKYAACLEEAKSKPQQLQ